MTSRVNSRKSTVKSRTSIILAFVILIAIAGARTRSSATQAPPIKPADLVLRSGKVVTVDEAKPAAEAIAVTAGTITAVGTNQDIQRYVGAATKVIDLKGALAVPGLIDAHTHFTGVGQAAMSLRLAKAKEWDDIVRMVADAAKTAKPGEW